MLTKYKSVHDHFQVLEICYTPISPVIYRDNALLESGQIDWNVLEAQVRVLRGSIDNLLDYAGRVFFLVEVAAWGPKLERARSELELGVANSDPEQIKNATNRIKVVLYRELSRVNNSLVAAAKGAQLAVAGSAPAAGRDGDPHPDPGAGARQTPDPPWHAPPGMGRAGSGLPRTVGRTLHTPA